VDRSGILRRDLIWRTHLRRRVTREACGELEVLTLVFPMDPQGGFLHDVDAAMIRRFAEVHPFHRLIAVSFSFSPELSGRVFCWNQISLRMSRTNCVLIQDLVRQVGPAVYTCICCVGCDAGLGFGTGSPVRELHDGAVQSLIGWKCKWMCCAELLQEFVNHSGTG